MAWAEQHFTRVGQLPLLTKITDLHGEPVTLDQAIKDTIKDLRACHSLGRKVIIIGNGGSASIASHMAIDFTKNGGIRTIALNDAAALTCTGNDFGYDHGFERMLEVYGDRGDTLIAISSSGKSQNILNAATAAVLGGIPVITFSGFEPNNPLRQSGYLNFYVPAGDYGSVEVTHLALLHAILDCAMGLQ
jgi:D-sedoheptulose 7-phosphate isomerase